MHRPHADRLPAPTETEMLRALSIWVLWLDYRLPSCLWTALEIPSLGMFLRPGSAGVEGRRCCQGPGSQYCYLKCRAYDVGSDDTCPDPAQMASVFPVFGDGPRDDHLPSP